MYGQYHERCTGQFAILTKGCRLWPFFGQLSGRSEHLESQSKRNNIIIDGVPEQRSESQQVTESKVKQMLADKLELNPKSIDVEYLHRKGKFEEQANRSRSVVIKLLRFKDKREIPKRKGKNLKGTKIFISEDFTDNVRQKWTNHALHEWFDLITCSYFIVVTVSVFILYCYESK